MTDQPKTALVTGASRGIGKAIAARLHADGYKVIGTATGQIGVDRINAELGPGSGYVLRIENMDSIKACIKAIEADGHSPTILLNNAGITLDALALRITEDAWDNVLKTDLTGVFHLTKLLVRHMMRARWGRIVMLSSVVVSRPFPGQAGYATAKAGLDGLMRALAVEFGSRNITVNSIAPGYIATDMVENVDTSALLPNIPLKRVGQPEDVAGAASYLVSDDASYVTGHVLAVNGGLLF